MTLSRRSVLTLGAAAALSGAVGARAEEPGWTRIKALAFDAFAVFDPNPIYHACEQAFPGRGTELANLWRTRQFEYQWLRALAGQYADFWRTTREALQFAAQSLKLTLAPSAADTLMNGFLALKAWPDVPDALSELRRQGRTLALLSNATPTILAAGLRNSHIEELFEHVISTDWIRSYKPDPRTYQLGTEVLGLRKEAILFVAFAGWDAAGAKWFGYPTFWNNRQGAAAEELAPAADGAGESLTDLVKFLTNPPPVRPS